MKNKIKVWIIIAVSLILVGGVIFTGVMSVLKWDFKKLSTANFETNSYETSEKYTNISIVTNTADVTVIPSENAQTTVVCYEETKLNHTVCVKDDTLSVEYTDTRKWYEHISFFEFGSPKITLYIPEGSYGNLSVELSTGDVEIADNFEFNNVDISGSTGNTIFKASTLNDLKIKRSTGHVTLENVTANNVNLTTSTGDINANAVDCSGKFSLEVTTGKANLTKVKCNNLSSSGNTGDITLINAIATNKFDIKRTTGNIKLDKCDANELLIKTSTGNVSGSLLSSKVFICKTNTGKVTVPSTVEGGKCEISTDTGNIKIEIEK